MRRFGVMSAGGGDWYSPPMHHLQIGDPLVVYQKQAGYVGYGKVTSQAVMAKDFQTSNGPLADQTLVRPNLFHDSDDPKLADYAVGVE